MFEILCLSHCSGQLWQTIELKIVGLAVMGSSDVGNLMRLLSSLALLYYVISGFMKGTGSLVDDNGKAITPTTPETDWKRDP